MTRILPYNCVMIFKSCTRSWRKVSDVSSSSKSERRINEGVRVPHDSPTGLIKQDVLHNDAMSPLFMAAIEATEEAIINSLFMAETMKGISGRTAQALPLDKVIPMLKKYNKIK